MITLTRFYGKIKALQAHVGPPRRDRNEHQGVPAAHTSVLYTLAKEAKEGDRASLQPGDLWWGDLLRQHADAPRPAVPLAIDDPAILLFSGGTTGIPKARSARITRAADVGDVLTAHGAHALADWDDTITLVMPMFHVYGNMAANTSLIARWPMAVVPTRATSTT